MLGEKTFFILLIAVAGLSWVSPAAAETGVSLEQRKDQILADAAVQAEYGLAFVPYQKNFLAEVNRLTGTRGNRKYNDLEAAVLAREHFRHIADFESKLATDAGLRYQYDQKMYYYLDQDSPFSVPVRGDTQAQESPADFAAWKTQKQKYVHEQKRALFTELLRLTDLLGAKFSISLQDGGRVPLTAETFGNITTTLDADMDGERVIGTKTILDRELFFNNYLGKPIREEYEKSDIFRSDSTEIHLNLWLDEQGRKGKLPANLEHILPAIYAVLDKSAELDFIDNVVRLSGNVAELKANSDYLLNRFHSPTADLIADTYDQLGNPERRRARGRSRYGPAAPNWNQFGNITSDVRPLLTRDYPASADAKKRVYLRSPVPADSHTLLPLLTTPFTGRPRDGETLLSTSTAEVVHESGLMEVYLPEGERLSALRLHTSDGRQLEQGKDFDLVAGKHPGDTFIKVGPHLRTHKLAYQAISAKTTEAQGPTAPGADLPVLQKQHLEVIRQHLEDAGLTAIADAIETELETHDSLTIEKLSRIVSENSLYSYAEIKRGTAQGRYEKHGPFLNEDGELTIQCKQAAVLLNDILEHYQELSGRFPGLDLFLRSGFIIPGDALRITTKESHAWLEIADRAGRIRRFDPTPSQLDPKSPKPVFRSAKDPISELWQHLLDSKQARMEFWTTLEMKMKTHAETIGAITEKLNTLIPRGDALAGNTRGLLHAAIGTTRALKTLTLDKDLPRTRDIVNALFPYADPNQLETADGVMNFLQGELRRVNALIQHASLDLPGHLNRPAIQLQVSLALGEANAIVKLFEQGRSSIQNPLPVRPLAGQVFCRFLYQGILAGNR